MNSLCQTVMRHLEAGSPLVLVTLMDQTGSAPRTAGARMLVLPGGAILGTVGGGRYEAEAIAAAKELHLQAARVPCNAAQCPGALMDYSLRGVTDMDMICGGALTLLLEYIPNDLTGALAAAALSPDAPPSAQPDAGRAVCHPETSPRQAVFAVAGEAEAAGAPFIFISRIRRDAACLPPLENNGTPAFAARTLCGATIERYVWLPGQNMLSPYGAELPEAVLAAAAALRTDAPRHMRLDDAEYLLEYFPRPWRVLLFGAGHVSREVARLAHHVGFQTIVADDRSEYAHAERFPHSRLEVTPSLDQEACAALLARMAPEPGDALVILTRGHTHDRDALAASLETRAGYIGMIGSKSKRAAVYASLEKQGVSARRLAAVHSPIGLGIGAETPEEIAVSIVAELIQWRGKTRACASLSGSAL